MAIFKDASVGDLTRFAAEQQRRFDAGTLPRERKERGHFGTPQVIADYMSQMFSEMPRRTIRILDPGAGVGTLSSAICQRVLRERSPRHLDLELWETDPKLVTHIQKTMDYCRKTLAEFGHHLDYTICIDDFILANSRKSLFEKARSSSFDLAILNPPYYKLQKGSPQAVAMEHVVHGQPNIYALFMALAADLLRPGGEMVAITPRSYFSGLYFKRFRKWFFDQMVARGIHVFESRTEAFHNDQVLQENVILHAKKAGGTSKVILTTSHGRDLTNLEKCLVKYGQVIDNSNGDRIVRVAANQFEREIVGAMDALPERFRGLGLKSPPGRWLRFVRRSTFAARNPKTPRRCCGCITCGPLLRGSHPRMENRAISLSPRVRCECSCPRNVTCSSSGSQPKRKRGASWPELSKLVPCPD